MLAKSVFSSMCLRLVEFGIHRCEFCDDEYFGDPLNDIACQRCECSGNIDENAIKVKYLYRISYF